MADRDNAANILFPNESSAPSSPPNWYQARQAAAENRLMGQHGQGEADSQAARMFPSEKGTVGGEARQSAGDADAAEKLFANDAQQFDARPVESIFDGFALSALGDGDVERAHEIDAAKDALIEDAKAQGSTAADLTEAMSIVHERAADTITDIPPEKLEADKVETMAILADEGVTDAQIRAAQAMISDLDATVAPGLIDTLARSGAGNDASLIRICIRESQRRGYR